MGDFNLNLINITMPDVVDLIFSYYFFFADQQAYTINLCYTYVIIIQFVIILINQNVLMESHWCIRSLVHLYDNYK